MIAKAPIYISSVVLIVCLILLATGSPILGTPLVQETAFPSGTLISWVGIIALTITIYLVFTPLSDPANPGDRIFRFAFKSIATLALLWGLIWKFLAGNWAFTFQNHDEFRGSIEASLVFWIYTASLVCFPVLLILVFCLFRLSWKFLKRSEQIPDNQDN
jgi:hypothetical protein